MKYLLSILLFLISLIVGGFIFFLIIDEAVWQEAITILFLFPLWQVSIIVALSLLLIIGHVYKWRLILSCKECNVPKTTLWKILMSNFFIMYLIPVIFFANEVFIVYLLKKHNIPNNKAIAFVFIEKIIAFTVSYFLITIGILISTLLIIEPLGLGLYILLPVLALVIFVIIILSFFYWKIHTKKSILQYFLRIFRLKNFKNGKFLDIEREIINFFNFEDKKVTKIFKVTFLLHFLVFIQLWLLVFFLTRDVLNILETFGLYTFTTIAHIFPFPAAIGGLELSSTTIFSVLNLTPGLAIAFSLILRGSMLIVALISAFCLASLLLNLLKTKINNYNNHNNNHINNHNGSSIK